MLNSQHLVDAVGEASAPDRVEVFSLVQDSVMDELGLGWPELYVNGRFVALLQPGRTGDQLVWLRSGRPLVPVGSLAELPEGTLTIGR